MDALLLTHLPQMNLFLANTDHAWYEFLRGIAPDEVNFWFPSGDTGFAALKPGEPLLFKAKAPFNAVIGGGHFVRYVRAPASLAWQAFGDKNGAPDFNSFFDRISRYRSGSQVVDPPIGCVLLNEPFFFPQDLWVPTPHDWQRNIVRGKLYATESGPGAELWDGVVAALADPRAVTGPAFSQRSALMQDEGLSARRGAPYLTTARLGQGAFRLSVLDAYQLRCAVTGERVQPVLEAAHIKPFALQGPNIVSNGLSLRADIHRLFDLGYVTVGRDMKFHVSSRLKTEFNNGVDYYRFNASALRVLPVQSTDRPRTDFLEWHNDVVFRS